MLKSIPHSHFTSSSYGLRVYQQGSGRHDSFEYVASVHPHSKVELVFFTQTLYTSLILLNQTLVGGFITMARGYYWLLLCVGKLAAWLCQLISHMVLVAIHPPMGPQSAPAPVQQMVQPQFLLHLFLTRRSLLWGPTTQLTSCVESALMLSTSCIPS